MPSGRARAGRSATGADVEPRGGAAVPGVSGGAQSTTKFYRPGRHTVCVDGYDASTYGDRYADVYDRWYADVTDVDACVVRLAHLAGRHGGPVLELGVGSGRLAIPLAAAGVEVHGIDASAAMLERLRAKPGSDAVQVTLGDMAVLDLDRSGPFGVVFAAYNTFFNLPDVESQAACLRRVAQLLAPGGVLVLEAFVPTGDLPSGAEASVAPRHITADEVVLTVSMVDRGSQTISGQHVHLSEAGIRLRPWHLRYATPEQLDALAASAGLTLVERHAGWNGEPFTEASGVHVSTYGGSIVHDVPHPAPAGHR